MSKSAQFKFEIASKWSLVFLSLDLSLECMQEVAPIYHKLEIVGRNKGKITLMMPISTSFRNTIEQGWEKPIINRNE
jgi:hypothetical protein